MISVGEQAGMLETMLQRAADYYETRVDNAIDRLIPLLEPAMMAALGGLGGRAACLRRICLYSKWAAFWVKCI